MHIIERGNAYSEFHFNTIVKDKTNRHVRTATNACQIVTKGHPEHSGTVWCLLEFANRQ